MSWSIKLATVSGIPVKLHLTFLLLLAWVGWGYWARDGTTEAVLSGVGFMLALFGCVLLHEFGHAFMARRYGIKTLDITLLPIGGVARLEKMPEDPKQELWVAVAGPAVNVVIAGAVLVYLAATSNLGALAQINLDERSFAVRLLVLNLILVGFNLLPAFPMDGGRILRAVLAMRIDHADATRYAAGIGQGMAVLLAILGLFGSPVLLLIAFFVWIGAGQEARHAQVKSAFHGIPVERAMQTNYLTLTPADKLSRAVELVLSGAQQDFPVLWDNEVIGMLNRKDLMAALAATGADTPVSATMQREFAVVQATDPLEPILERLSEINAQTIPVLRDGRLAGLITLENLSEFMMIQAALRTSPGGSRQAP